MGEIRRLVHPSAWTALLLAATLAGCAGGDESPAAVPSPTPAADEVEDTIRIFGIVQDAAVQPLAGATVRVPVLGLNTTTGADGRFSFDDIAPGRYVVEADAADHRGATLTTDGQELLFVLPRFAEQPFQSQQVFQGIWQCAAEYLIITPNCDEAVRLIGGPTVTEGESEFDLLTEPNWKTMVVDVVYDGGHPGIAGLRTAVSATLDSNELGSYEKYGDFSGPESFTFHIEPGATYSEGVPIPSNATGLRLNVYPLSHGYHATCDDISGPCFLGVGAAVDVQFELIVTLWYVEPAPEGWTARA